VLFELKRNRTPREVVAQAIDYAAWIESLSTDRIAQIYQRFSGGGNLDEAFRQRFKVSLDEDALNESHQFILVAAELDDSTERIINYLNARDIAINVIYFQVFQDGPDPILSRAWLIDPGEAAAAEEVSISTVQREARRDPDFDQQLQAANAVTPDPLAIMKRAARTHWRAAAWLLERSDPEHYGRRPASSCSPVQFQQALRTVLEAALEVAAPAERSAAYGHVAAACEAAFKTVFPLYGPWGRRVEPEFAATPLTEAEQLARLRSRPPRFHVPDYVDEPVNALTNAAADAPDPPTSPTPAAASEQSAPTAAPLPAAPQRRSLAVSSATASRPPVPDARLPWQYALRTARKADNPIAPPNPINNGRPSELSPKTPPATPEFGAVRSQPDQPIAGRIADSLPQQTAGKERISRRALASGLRSANRGLAPDGESFNQALANHSVTRPVDLGCGRGRFAD
jgi:hypothetical protein